MASLASRRSKAKVLGIEHRGQFIVEETLRDYVTRLKDCISQDLGESVNLVVHETRHNSVYVEVVPRGQISIVREYCQSFPSVERVFLTGRDLDRLHIVFAFVPAPRYGTELLKICVFCVLAYLAYLAASVLYHG
jgi:hypothetical protein